MSCLQAGGEDVDGPRVGGEGGGAGQVWAGQGSGGGGVKEGGRRGQLTNCLSRPYEREDLKDNGGERRGGEGSV